MTPHISLCIKCQFYDEKTGKCIHGNDINSMHCLPDVLVTCNDFLIKEQHVFFGG